MKRTILFALLVAGCAPPAPATGPTVAQKESRDISRGVDGAVRSGRECVAAIEKTADYERLSDRFSFGPPPMTILVDKRKPAASDIPALMKIHSQLSSCRAQSIQAYSVAHPAFVSVAATTYAEGDIDFAKLIRRDISWGEYAERSLERGNRFSERYRAAADKINANLKNAHAYEVRERQAASQALADWSRAQQVAAPVYTNCVYRGAILSCASY